MIGGNSVWHHNKHINDRGFHCWQNVTKMLAPVIALRQVQPPFEQRFSNNCTSPFPHHGWWELGVATQLATILFFRKLYLRNDSYCGMTETCLCKTKGKTSGTHCCRDHCMTGEARVVNNTPTVDGYLVVERVFFGVWGHPTHHGWTTCIINMNDFVGTGPDEHFMSDFEHMKTSLHLTDVVVLRHEGDTVNFSGLEMHALQKSKPQSILVDAQQWWSSRQQLHWSRLLQLSHSRRKNSSSWHLGDETCNSPSNNYPHKSPQPHDREQARSETVDAISQKHATHLSSSWTARNGSNKFAGTRWS